jgi:hypothetical protein
VLNFAAVHRFEQGFARGEMPVKGADAHAGGPRDCFEAGFRATSAENRFRCLKDPLAIPQSIDALLSRALHRLPHPNVQSQQA